MGWLPPLDGIAMCQGDVSGMRQAFVDMQRELYRQ